MTGADLIISIDEVTTELLVNAITAAGRWLGTAAATTRSERKSATKDLAVARWFETYELTKRVPQLPEISVASASRLMDLLRSNGAQAAIQELLAVRLSDGSNADAKLVRDSFVATLAEANNPEISGCAQALASYYDDEISELVGRLADTPLLTQIRSEALSGRMIAVLHAIERHTAALVSRPALRTEADFLTRYRAHVLDQHGKLEPPDFERRHRVSISDIYVPTVIYEEDNSERTRQTTNAEPPSLTVWELADRLDRTVLLGDPGGGKTTASTVLMHHFASDGARRTPFLVTLRNFAAEDPPARSVVGFIEHELETLYQCPALPGFIDLLLLTGRAVVIFDGLDELLDTARRADVSMRVERFCTEYPLAPVLVTSRVVGYDQARLDDSQFSCYRLGGFRDEDVAEYTRKWFDLDKDAKSSDADAFMNESESVPDLRSNPLMLSLMCILYRGEGSLPRNRAEVYEQCSNLLFRRWDARRRIHQELRAGHLLEPALRHLAWWLFTRPETQTAVTERELVTATTEFLHRRGFESMDEAREAAREFVSFCRGRMWVFSDHGTTASGEKLYAFTHRTFLEYFAAAQLAYDSDTPERLAQTLAPRVARGEWAIVGELAVQIKDSTSREGATRIYELLLNERRKRQIKGRSNVLQFLARTLRSVDPSPEVIRHLTKQTVDFLQFGDADEALFGLPLSWLLASCDRSLGVVDEELVSRIDAMVRSEGQETHIFGLRLATMLTFAFSIYGGEAPKLPASHRLRIHWNSRRDEMIKKYRDAIIAAEREHVEIRYIALQNEFISISQVLRSPEDFQALIHPPHMKIFGQSWAALLSLSFLNLALDSNDEDAEEEATASKERMLVAGQYLSSIGSPPWMQEPIIALYPGREKPVTDICRLSTLDPIPYLASAVVAFTMAETDEHWAKQMLAASPKGIFTELYPYIERRDGNKRESLLRDLPVPDKFKPLFREWAEGRVHFIRSATDSLDPDAGESE
jgi:hypothetical protein